MGSLMALGASGGLVPCPSALVLLLSSVALGGSGSGYPAGGVQRGAGGGADGGRDGGAVRQEPVAG